MSSRQQALLSGASTYFTGTACKSGHVSERFTVSRQCVECSKSKGSRYYHANGGNEVAKYRHIEKKYGLTRAAFDEMLAAQDCKCAICRTVLVINQGNGHSELAVDHCHTTQAVRGLLCNNCNRGLGMFKDNPEALRRAAAYLERK